MILWWQEFCVRARLRLLFLVLWFGGWALGLGAVISQFFGHLEGVGHPSSFLTQPLIACLSTGLISVLSSTIVLALLLSANLSCDCGR
ncbi:MAG: hypothetical protein AAF415_18485 [Pseudomonadota bacterium]